MAMKSAAKFLFFILLGISPLFLAACNHSQSIHPPPTFTVGGTVVNLADNGGGLVLQDNGGDNLMVNANGNFHFATPLPSGTPYKVTVFMQPSSPAQTCAATNAAGTGSADVTNVKIDCGHNEWAWVTGSQTVNQMSTYGTLGMPAAGNTPGGRQFPATWTDTSGNLWLFNSRGPERQLWDSGCGCRE